MDKCQVAVMACESYDISALMQKINAGAECIGGWDQWLKSGMNVLLKVNLIGPLSSETAAVTHCEFVRAVTRILKTHGCHVWIGDSSGGAIGGKAQTGRSFSVSGIQKVADEEGAVIKNFDKEGAVEVTTQSGDKIFIAKPMFDADLVINLPKLKTHMAAVYTGAVKNLFGCIPGLKKAEYHKIASSTKSFGQVICDINQAVKIGINIMDGVLAMDKQGPISGGIYKANKILMSTDSLALDTVACSMIGLDIERLPIFEASINSKIGEWRSEHIALCGDFTAVPKLTGYRIPKALLKGSKDSKALGKIIDLMKTRPKVNLKTCKKCNVCVESCPVQAIDKESKSIDYDTCIECMCCHELCVHKAVKLVNVNPVMRFFSVFRRQD